MLDGGAIGGDFGSLKMRFAGVDLWADGLESLP